VSTLKERIPSLKDLLDQREESEVKKPVKLKGVRLRKITITGIILLGSPLM